MYEFPVTFYMYLNKPYVAYIFRGKKIEVQFIGQYLRIFWWRIFIWLLQDDIMVKFIGQFIPKELLTCGHNTLNTLSCKQFVMFHFENKKFYVRFKQDIFQRRSTIFLIYKFIFLQTALKWFNPTYEIQYIRKRRMCPSV